MRTNFGHNSRSRRTATEWLRLVLRTGLELALILASSLAINTAAFAQTAPARPDRGMTPGGSYSISDIENVNMTNGNVSLSIPLASLPPIAGGKLSDSIRAVYNSKLWDVKRRQVVPDPLNPGTAYQTNHLQLADFNGGWVIDGGYSIAFFHAFDDFEWEPLPNDPENEFLTSHVFVKCMLTTPDGSQHELRPLDFSPYTDPLGNHPNLKGYYTDYPGNQTSTMRYYSYDGSYLWAIIDPMSLGLVATSWKVYMQDGSSVSMNNGLRKMRDSSGNRINVFISEDSPGVFTTHHVDNHTAREIQWVYDISNPNNPIGHVKYQAVFGGWVTVDVIYRTSTLVGQAYLIGDALCPDTAELPSDTTFNVLDSIVLPQTEPSQQPRKFVFTYSTDTTVSVNYSYRLNCSQAPIPVTTASKGFGSLSSMTLPAGARVDYSYFLDIDINGSPTGPLQDANDAAADRIVRKTLTHDGPPDVWDYGISSSASGVAGPEGSVSQNYYPREPWAQHLFGGLDGKGGLVYRTNQSNKVITERHWTHNSFPTPGSPTNATGSSELAAFNPLVDFEYTTLLDQNGVKTKISTKAMQYDFNGNLKSVTEYDFVDDPDNPNVVQRDSQGVPIGIPAGSVALRTTVNTYYNPADTGTSANIYAKRLTATETPKILNAPRTSVTGPSQAEFYYDGNQNLNTPPTSGNLTKERRFVEGTKWVETTHTYDPSTSNVTSTTDPNLNVTQFFYDATKALPSSVVVNPLNGTGQQTTSTVYDFSSGLPLSVTDPNGRTTSSSYVNQLLNAIDPFGRPGVVTDPQGRTTVSRYRDSLRQLEVWSDLNSANDGMLRTRTTSDKLGRPVKTESAEDGVNYTISADSVYQQMGRVVITINPKRTGSASTDGWTRSTKDDLGRVVTVESFSGQYPSGSLTGTVQTSYHVNDTTVTDQAGKVRRSIVDALGRLIRVDEPNGAGSLGSLSSPNQPTSYIYDSRGNLTQVSQGGQSRTFTYDGLSRLKQANNPESGATNYTYYDNGNLETKTDARGVVTTLTYDGLNRITTRIYSGAQPGPSTPAVTYTYDTLGAGLNGKGRLTSVSSSASSHSYGSYDVMGRPVTSTQSTNGQNYNFSYQYNLTGAMTSQTYPSGRVVTTGVDSAGRISSVSGQKSGEPNKTYSSNFSYTAHGAIASVTLGNNLIEGTTFNGRLQPTFIKLGTSGNPTSVLQLGYEYTSACQNGNNGNVMRQTIAAPGLSLTQDYCYDSLNRLSSASENSGANWSQTYGYDRWGNRWVSASSGYTLSGLTPTSGGAFNTANNRIFASSYDFSGNQTSDALGRTFDYDAENHQTKFNTSAGQYFYDGDGRRVKKIDDGGTTVFVHNAGGQLIAEYRSDPVPPAAGGGGTSYLTSDHLGSTRVVTGTNPTQPMKARYDYVPFGEELGSGIGGRTLGMGYGAADSTRQKFTQKERDNESGLDYFLARYYSSSQGRFTTSDEPFADQDEIDPQTWNLYSYVINNPLKYDDPLGLWKRKKTDDGTLVYIAEKGDTWEGLAKILHVPVKSLIGSLGGGKVKEGQEFDVTNYRDYQRDTFDRFVFLIPEDQVPGDKYRIELGFSIPGMGRLKFGSKASSALGKVVVKGLAQNRPLRQLTAAEIRKAFAESGYSLTNHAIKRLKDPRTDALGIRTLNDVKQLLNNGTISPADGGKIAIEYGRLKAIVEPITKTIVTLSPK
jgi:RHS repeat-associated protein